MNFMEPNRRIKLLIDGYQDPVNALYIGKVNANDMDPVTGQWCWYYHSVNIRWPSGEWENLWMSSAELEAGLRGAASEP